MAAMNAPFLTPASVDPQYQVTADMARAVAYVNGVCIRPLMRRVLDRETGTDSSVALPCGSTRESVCPACADKARRLRIQQCAEGWHRDTEPDAGPAQRAAMVTRIRKPT